MTRILIAALAVACAALDAGCSAADSEPDVFEMASPAQCSVAGAWAPRTACAAGVVVTYRRTTYRCVQSHTSQPDWTPPVVPALWPPASCSRGRGVFGAYKDTSI